MMQLETVSFGRGKMNGVFTPFEMKQMEFK